MPSKSKGVYSNVVVSDPFPGEKSGILQVRLQYETNSERGGSRYAWIPATSDMVFVTGIKLLRKAKVADSLLAPIIAAHKANGTASKPGKSAPVVSDDDDESDDDDSAI